MSRVASRRRYWLLALVALFCVGVAGLNWLAYKHAYAMSHFVEGGEKTAVPEEMSWWDKGKVLLTGVRLPRPLNKVTPADVGLKFETWNFETDDGLVLEAWSIPAPENVVATSGLPPVALLFHGYGASKASQLPAARLLNELGCACLLVDLRGAGGSSGKVTTLGYEEAKDVAASTRFVRLLFPERRLILLGTSMGAVAILRAVAHEGVTADALILEAPFDEFYVTVCNRFDRMGLPSFPMAHLLLFWGGLEHGYDGYSHNPAAYAALVSIPTLHIHGELDTNVTQPQAERVHAALAGPKEFCCFEGAGHECYAAFDATDWKRRVETFLEAQHASKEEK